MRRALFLSLAVLLGLQFTPGAMISSAEAVTINIQIGSSLNNGRGITCWEGERLLRSRGFRDVRRMDCRGRYFVYRAWRGGSRFEIALRSSNGRVADIRRISR